MNISVMSLVHTNYFLFNDNETGEKRCKLVLTQSDRDTLSAIIENKPVPEECSENLVNNFEYFQDNMARGDIDLDAIWRGISKLVMVDISLDADSDRPQVIFESLNSTGLELSKTDLIRNYLLMDLRPDMQEEIYADFWRPMEKMFERDPREFDEFMKNYLTVRKRQIPTIRDMYPTFKEYARGQLAKKSIKELVADIHHLAKFYALLAFEDEQDGKLNQRIRNINALKNHTAYPFLLEIYADYDGGRISRDSILEMFEMVESYTFRRAVCEIPTNSHNLTFAGLVDRMGNDKRVERLKAAFLQMSGYRRFPTDKEFEARLAIKDVYNTVHIRKHLFDRLENHGRKERVNVDDYTLEHVMPQNDNLSEEWKDMLGPDWKDVHEECLHMVGNLTLTGYNSELSDRPFLEKRDMAGGFADSPLRLNADLAGLGRWGRPEILERGRSLAKKASEVWGYPDPPPGILETHTAKMGEDDDDDPEYEEAGPAPQFESQLARASVQVQSNTDMLMSQIRQRFSCVEEVYSRWLMLYVRKPTERKTLFALLWCGKNTANVAFRIDPDAFEASENVRKVAGWFFPAGTERRISLTADTAPEIMANLEHAHNATLRALDIRRVR